MNPEPLQGEYVPLSRIPQFDPRQAPLVGVDRHLPAVTPVALTADALRRRFARPPAWEPEIWAEKFFGTREPSRASVLVPIVQRQVPTILLTQRTAHLSNHSGQIAFPGGKADDSDRDAAHTAMREAEEEIGLRSNWIEVLGEMPTYTTGSRFVVTPVVALVHPDHQLTLNANEVADAFEVPLAHLMNPAHHERRQIEFAGQTREWFAMPYDDAGVDRFIWGATAGMLRNLYRFLVA